MKKRWLIIGLGSLLVVSFCFTQEVNLLKNPGFEDVIFDEIKGQLWPRYWDNAPPYICKLTVVEESENVHSGKRAIRIETTEKSVANSAQLWNWRPGGRLKVFSDTTYEFSCWAKGEGDFYLIFYQFKRDKDNKLLRATQTTLLKLNEKSLTSEWKKYTTIYTPGDATEVTPVIRLDGKGAWAYVDDVCLKEVEEE